MRNQLHMMVNVRELMHVVRLERVLARTGHVRQITVRIITTVLRTLVVLAIL